MTTNRLHRYDTLTAWYEEHLTINNYSSRTIKDYLFELSFFRRFVVSETDKADIDEFDAEMLRNYTAALYNNNNTPRTIHHKISALRNFFKTLYIEHKLYIDLTNALIMPRIGKGLPTSILTEEETKTLFDYLEHVTDSVHVDSMDSALLLRDRAILEVLYSTGIRRNELLSLHLGDVNYSDGLITIRNGKGGKDRVVPIGGTSLESLDRYVREARPRLSGLSTKDHLFLNRFGNGLSAQGLRELVNKKFKETSIKRVRIHDMRHTCATHMLNHGADIRYVQELLGHDSLSSTQVYTHVSINKLKETHNKFHPREQKGE